MLYINIFGLVSWHNLSILHSVLSRIILALSLFFNFNLASVRHTYISSWAPITIRSYDPLTKEGFEFIVPDDLEVETITGKGNWLVSKLRQVKDVDWVRRSLEDALGVPIDKNKRFITWGIKWEKKSIEKYVITKLTADGISVKKLDSSWEKTAKDWFVSTKLAEQRSVLRIENTVNFPGLGGHVARILESYGIKVGLIISNEQNLQKCEVLGSGLVAEFVAKKFDCNTKEGDELILRLGKDYLNYWKGE